MTLIWYIERLRWIDSLVPVEAIGFPEGFFIRFDTEMSNLSQDLQKKYELIASNQNHNIKYEFC
jgi:hypothetical protein